MYNRQLPISLTGAKEGRCSFPFEILSDDAVQLILSRLPVRHLLSSAALVCRRWYKLSATCPVKELRAPSLGPCPQPWGRQEDKVLQLTEVHKNNLEVLELKGLQRLHEEQLSDVLTSMPQLKELHIVACPLVMSVDATRLPLPQGLQHLDMHCDHFATDCHTCGHTPPPLLLHDNLITSLAQQCTLLRHLDLDACSDLSPSALSSLASAVPSLRHLSLHSHSFGWLDCATLLGRLQELEHFSLVSPRLAEDKLSAVDSRALASAAAPTLASLSLESAPHRSVLWDRESMAPLLQCVGPRLFALAAETTFSATWQTIGAFCSTNLTSLDLAHPWTSQLLLTQMEETALCSMLRLLPGLRRLALPAATDNVLRVLSVHCTGLTELRFQGHSPPTAGAGTGQYFGRGASDQGVRCLAQGCPQLKLLSLARCSSLTISAARKGRECRAVAYGCHNLQVLHLSGGRGMNDAAMDAVLARLRGSLRLLDIQGCAGVTPHFFRILSVYAKNMPFSIRVVGITSALRRKSSKTIEQLQKVVPHLCVRTDAHAGVPWDGFLHTASFYNND